MNMKERMLNGEPCLTFDEELVQERQHQQRLQFKFNNLDPDDEEGRVHLLKEMLGGTGDNVWMERPIYFDYGKNTYVGEMFYANTGLTVLDGAKVTIGDNVFCAPYVGIYTAGHPVHPYPRNMGIEYNLSVTIGNNVWIGAQSVINPGVTIGDNVVIGSGSVVTKDIPSNVIAVGNPCRVLREITEEDKACYFRDRKIDEEFYNIAKTGIDKENFLGNIK
ncbi:MAG: sugar O-acetyltransferase [Oscillospiraceae bacterium]|nr:sugar O-acetyltransferase [Oscillospiraceae bacterium]